MHGPDDMLIDAEIHIRYPERQKAIRAESSLQRIPFIAV
jgi:hypothetical protein